MKTLFDNRDDYLKESYYINWKNPDIMNKAGEIKEQLKSSEAAIKSARISYDKVDYIKIAYHFVRDQISHSWDIQDNRVTIRASEVLLEKVGICWAKSNLLAALLRAEGIPCGICYQRLTLGDTPDTGYCVHALNAVFIEEIGRWVRMDARGNKNGAHGEFSLEQEILAFTVRKEYDEIDYEEIHAEPLQMTMDMLERSTDVLHMYHYDLPELFGKGMK